MAERVNQAIADRLTERQLRVGRAESHLRREVWEQLRLLEEDILAALKATDPTQWALLARRRREVEILMVEEIDPLVQSRYQRLADLLDDAMMRLAQHEAEAVQQIVNDETEDETMAALPSERRLRAGVVHGLFPSTVKPTEQAAEGRAWWQRQGEGLAQRLGDSLLVGVSLEESLTDLTQRVKGTREAALTDGLMGKAREDAARLVRTQTTNALGDARAAVAERNATQLMLVHSSILDSSTSSICIARHGLKFDAVTHDPIGHSIPYLNGVPYHPNCVIGSTRVFATGIQGTSQREYIGEVVTIRTQRGYELTCTPNHPILTNQGWVAAHALDIGSRLVCCSRQERPIDLIDMNGKDCPSRIQDIVEASQQTGSMASVPVPVATEDFHGDGRGSKIAIIGTDGLLRNRGNAAFMEPLMELQFQRLHRGFLLQRLGFLHQCFQRCFTPSAGNIGRYRLSLTFFKRFATPLLLFLFATCPELDIILKQTSSNDTISNMITMGQFIQREATLIGSNHLGEGELFTIRPDYAELVESLEKCCRLYTMLYSEASHTLPSEIVFDDVIHRHVDHWRGHVYNLQTLSGCFIANNIITHNCRSSMLTVLKNGGPVRDESLSAWLRRKGPAFQDEVLGPTRARMFRNGLLSPRQLIDSATGKPLTLEELGA